MLDNLARERQCMKVPRNRVAMPVQLLRDLVYRQALWAFTQEFLNVCQPFSGGRIHQFTHS